jgi:hypothetical protein
VLACAAADRLQETLKIREEALIKGKKLVDELMGVVDANRRLAAENERLTAIVEGLEPPKDSEIKA